MDAQDFRSLQEAYMDVYQEQELDEALTGERLQRAKKIIEKDPKSPKAKAVKRVAGSQEGSDRGDTVPGDLPRDRRNTTLPTGRGGRGRKGLGKTTNRPGGGGGYPLGGRVGQSDQGRGNRATRRSGGDVEDTRYDEQVDIYDIILSHLLDEGYAETPEAAEVIMVNMSEGWREEIMEGVRPTPVDKPLDKAAFKKRRRSLAGREASADARSRGHEGSEWHNTGRTYSPDEAKSRRKNMSDTHRSLSYGTAESPDDNTGYPAVKTKNPKKLRKQKAMGEHG